MLNLIGNLEKTMKVLSRSTVNAVATKFVVAYRTEMLRDITYYKGSIQEAIISTIEFRGPRFIRQEHISKSTECFKSMTYHACRRR